MIPLTGETVARAVRLLRTIRPPYAVRQNQAVETVLARLSDERVRPRTWVREPVIRLYRILGEHGFLRTIEAMENGMVAGAVLAIDLPGVLITESMFSLAPNSSKQCVCEAMKDYYEHGYAFIDVENKHPAIHPLARLGEKVFPMAEYLRLLRETVHRFAGGCGMERREQLRRCDPAGARSLRAARSRCQDRQGVRRGKKTKLRLSRFTNAHSLLQVSQQSRDGVARRGLRREVGMIVIVKVDEIVRRLPLGG
jgi:Leu/Phe-tRNA-protein transferase